MSWHNERAGWEDEVRWSQIRRKDDGGIYQDLRRLRRHRALLASLVIVLVGVIAGMLLRQFSS